ncbi:MAG TPA: hypothetical protein VGH28_30260 [Polyangiaceae bacterium]|jgi:hypothetical protein
MRRAFFFLLFASAAIACAARTEISDLDADDEEPDSSFADVTPPPPDDVSVPDVSVPDVTPPPPPDDASVDVIVLDVQPPPIDAPDDIEVPSCPDPCFSNHQCENECSPALVSGRYCCDEQTNTCYAWSGKHCPIVIFDAGFD